MSAPVPVRVDGPPPPVHAPRQRREPAAHQRPAPPAGAVPPQPWPPPEGDPRVCMLREMNGRDVTTKCGKLLRLKKDETQSDHASIWHTQVTCEHCLVRMGVANA